MHAPFALLKHLGRALDERAWKDAAGNLDASQVFDVVRETWNAWSRGRSESQRRSEIEAVLQTDPDEVRKAVAALVADISAGRPIDVRRALATYLSQIPSTICHWLRRPSDPTGRTVPSRLPLDRAEDLLPFLPFRLPRFRVGDAPLPGVDWELTELLGVGGFGEVWKAQNPNLSSVSPVALKFCLDPPSARVLRNEAKLLDRLMLQGRHPGIVGLRQTYLSAEPPCLEYDYIPGGNLAGLVLEWHRHHRHAPTPAKIAQVVRRLTRIVAFAHQLNPPIVHRDLKPANVLVQYLAGGKLSLRIADFGNGGVAASQAIRHALRRTSEAEQLLAAVRGACMPLYASPQQLRGDDADPRDDVYALGVIWYQMLTGDLTTGRPGGNRWHQRLAEQGMPRPLIDLLGACFEDDPADRPHNAQELLDRLSALLQAREEPTKIPAEPSPASSQGTAHPRRFANATGMVLALIPAGMFRMGSPVTEAERGSDEGPVHDVTITQPFYLCVYPVTQRQYERVMGINPSYFNVSRDGGADYPVESVAWHDAMEFCRRLSELPAERAARRVYRLPTEAEWEYACRAGTQTQFSFGMELSAREANFNGNYPYGVVPKVAFLERTTKVGSYPPNSFGLYDMHGNVWEWCADYYDRAYYRHSPRYDPSGPSSGSLRVVRGGSCMSIGRFCRSAYRFGVAPENRDLDVGLRVVLTVSD
jgi:formylglycine-generating enzyme required for sulfatase activity